MKTPTTFPLIDDRVTRFYRAWEFGCGPGGRSREAGWLVAEDRKGGHCLAIRPAPPEPQLRPLVTKKNGVRREALCVKELSPPGPTIQLTPGLMPGTRESKSRLEPTSVSVRGSSSTPYVAVNELNDFRYV